MIGRRRANEVSNDRRWELRGKLADILTLRAQGLITQREYEEKLEEVENSLPKKAHLEEHDLPRGRTRFVLRETGLDRVLWEFEFHDGHPVDA